MTYQNNSYGHQPKKKEYTWEDNVKSIAFSLRKLVQMLEEFLQKSNPNDFPR